MSERIKTSSPTASEIMAKRSRERNVSISSPLEGPRALEAAYAAKPFMDVAVELHKYGEESASEDFQYDDLGLKDLVDYAEKKAHEAANGVEITNVSADEATVLDAYRADITMKKTLDSEAVDNALDNLATDINGHDPRKKQFSNYVDQHLKHTIKNTDGEEQRRYKAIRERLTAFEGIDLDNDVNDFKKYWPEDSYRRAIVSLELEKSSPQEMAAVRRDIDKSNKLTDFYQFMAESYRTFESQETKTTQPAAEMPADHASHSMSTEELARTQEMIAGMNRSKREKTSVPTDPKELDAFEREYFSNPEHTIPTDQNIKVLSEAIMMHAKRMAENMRTLQQKRADNSLRYPGTPHTFWFSGDTVTGADPTGGKDKLLFEYAKEQLEQPGLTYSLILTGLPMDKIAKMMGTDLRAEIPDYDSLFSTPSKKSEYQPLYNILDKY